MEGRRWQSGCGTSACLWTVCLSLSLLWGCQRTDGAISRHSGLCVYNDAKYEPGQTFYKGCDKCFCTDDGYICFSPMKPTAWPKKCQRIPADCGYKVVYRDQPGLACRAYSWVW